MGNVAQIFWLTFVFGAAFVAVAMWVAYVFNIFLGGKNGND